MTLILFPRLPRNTIVELHHHHSGATGDALSRIWSTGNDQQFYTQTAGVRVSEVQLLELRSRIVGAAENSGFPGLRRQKEIADFDVECAKILYNESGVPMVEAMRADVWSFLSLVLLPDIASWRYPGLPFERINGGVRDVFRRLWQRGFHIAAVAGFDTRWDLLSELSEDAFVQILERPGLAADRRLSRLISEVWVEIAGVVGKKRMENLHRDAVRNIRAIYPLICFETLDDESLRKLVEEEFQQCIAPANQ